MLNYTDDSKKNSNNNDTKNTAYLTSIDKFQPHEANTFRNYHAQVVQLI